MSLFQDLSAMKSRYDLPAVLVKHGLNKRICELGVYLGGHFAHLLNAKPELIVGVDLWSHDGNPDKGCAVGEPQNYAGLCEKYKDNKAVYFIRQLTTEAAAQFPDGYFDCVYLDACHDYEYVKADIAAWNPKIKSGGILCGHDYTPSFPGVIRAVQEHFNDSKQANIAVITEPGNTVEPSWYMVKP